jgi:hypothetical protein
MAEYMHIQKLAFMCAEGHAVAGLISTPTGIPTNTKVA